MKSILVFSALFLIPALSSTASALPAKGDYVRHKITNLVSGKTFFTEQKIEITDVNSVEGNFTTKITLTANGTVLSESTEVQDLGSAGEAETTVDHCSELPVEIASLESIKVPAGTFKVCHLKSVQEGAQLDQYLGKVLFGLVKSVLSNPTAQSTITYELIEIKKN